MALTSFTISNDTDAPMIIMHEPEGAEWEFPVQEEITVISNACENSVFIKTYLKDGQVCLAILDDNSDYKVYHKGEDLFNWLNDE